MGVVLPIAYNPSCFWIGLSNNFIKQLRHWLRRLISVPNSEMSELVVDFVDVMLQSSRGELSNLGGILIDRFVFVISDKCVQII